MTRLVADANVLISAALARSPQAPAAQIFDAALDGRLELITSPMLLAEVTDVLHRPRLRRYLSGDEADRFVADLRVEFAFVADAPQPHQRLCRDPADDYLVALTLHVQAAALVSGDRDLHELVDPAITVLSPRQALELIQQEP